MCVDLSAHTSTECPVCLRGTSVRWHHRLENADWLSQGTETFAVEQKRWSKYILDTQAVVEAVLSSLRAGGAPVEL
jgi:hypothetical protein